MSKQIRLSDEQRAAILQELMGYRMFGGQVSLSKTYTTQEKATILYTPMAWAKQTALIMDYASEVAWHGVAERVEDAEGHVYRISDIVVYPQTVSGTTVDMDVDRYANWLIENIDDERFDHLCMQGHSHVNMAPSPSGVDLNHQEEVVRNQLGEDAFYIFMIWNKSFKSNTKIYDLRENILFEDSDITITMDGGDSVAEFLAEAKKQVLPKAAQTKTPVTQSYQPAKQQASSTAFRPPVPVTPAPATKPQDRPKSTVTPGWSGAVKTGYDWADDEDYYYDRFGGYYR